MSTRYKVFAAFDGKAGKVVSGSWLAKRLHLSRASVWKHVRALQRHGMPIQSVSRSGYRLDAQADASLAAWSLPKGLKGWAFPHYDLITASTQAPAKEAGERGLPEGHLWIAERQTAGRGRLGRSWSSDIGGLWISLLLRPSIPPARTPPLPLVAALTLAEVLRKEARVEARLKWPNDVGIGSGEGWRKVAGFLTELSAEVDQTKWLVLGLGLNVLNELPRELRKSATTLRAESDRPLSRARLLAAFLLAFRDAYWRFERAGFEEFRSRYWELYRSPGERVSVHTARGRVVGRARGVDGNGGLIVEFRRQMVHLLEGEILE